MKEIYLDNSATTAVCREAAEKALEIMTEKYGNPSSLHSKGLEAQHELENARKIIADFISADPTEIFFTSGGTEGNNTAVFGAAQALKRRGNRIVTTSVEHSSVIEAMQKLQKDGFDVVFLEPERNGKVSSEKIINSITKDTILVSIMAVNNEIGTIQPIECVHKAIVKAGSPALFHVDAVQAFGKIPLKPKKLGIDIMTASSHKIHGVKGAGVLYVRKGARIIPLHYGGEQEKKIRPGTEPLPAICGMAAAVKALPDMNKEAETMRELWNYCRERLSGFENVSINSTEDCLPYIMNFSVEGIRSETMLHFLASKGIYVSSGSACAKGKKSHVLSALGLESELADSAIRVSFSRYNTKNDIDELVSAIKIANDTLARAK
ncbi:MAG: cysteine desulfurase family protein [Acutalibacteraceae bacterium]